RQGHGAVGAADDVPDRQLADELRPHDREDDRVAGASGPADGHDLLDPELLDHEPERLGAHVRLGAPIDLDVGPAAVWPVPEQDPLAALDQRVDKLVGAGVGIAEPTAQRYDESPP